MCPIKSVNCVPLCGGVYAVTQRCVINMFVVWGRGWDHASAHVIVERSTHSATPIFSTCNFYKPFITPQKYFSLKTYYL